MHVVILEARQHVDNELQFFATMFLFGFAQKEGCVFEGPNFSIANCSRQSETDTRRINLL